MFFVDNQVLQGATGYWVYQVFEDDSVGRVLINRGFVASNGRQRLPAVPTPPGDLRLTATVWPQLGLIPAWGSQDWSADWPKRVQRANVMRMSTTSGTWPVELRGEPGQPSVLQAAPFASRVSDETHRGYAATWFGLAVVLLLGSLYLGFTSPKSERDRQKPGNILLPDAIVFDGILKPLQRIKTIMHSESDKPSPSSGRRQLTIILVMAFSRWAALMRCFFREGRRKLGHNQ